MLRVIPLLSAVALLLSSPSQAAFVPAAPASLPPATSENASTAFLEGGSESRIGLLCHNDPVNKTDPLGFAPEDPFGSVADAVRDVHSFINPTSIRENAEYGSVIYKGGDGNYYASKPFSDGAGNKVVVGAPNDHSRVPERGKRVGDYHTHGDYSKPGRKDPATGKAMPERVSNKRDDKYDSDHFSGPGEEKRGRSLLLDISRGKRKGSNLKGVLLKSFLARMLFIDGFKSPS